MLVLKMLCRTKVVLPQTSYFLVTLCLFLPVFEPTSSIEIIKKIMDAIHSAKKNYIQAEGSEMRFIRMKKKSILERKITKVEKGLQ